MKIVSNWEEMFLVCECDGEGVASDVCDPYSGNCPCSEGFAGPRCSVCAPGYHNYPLCQRCRCSEVGTTDQVSVILQINCGCLYESQILQQWIANSHAPISNSCLK